MFIIHLMSNFWIAYFTNIVIALGALLTLISFILDKIPFFIQYKLAARILSIVVLSLGIYFKGCEVTELKWRTEVESLNQQLKQAEEKSNQVNVVIQDKIVEKIKYVEKKVYITKTKIEKQRTVINQDCKIHPEVIDIYNEILNGGLNEK